MVAGLPAEARDNRSGAGKRGRSGPKKLELLSWPGAGQYWYRRRRASPGPPQFVDHESHGILVVTLSNITPPTIRARAENRVVGLATIV